MVHDGIRYRYADIGHYIARCNHRTGVIELNRREYPRLSPMMKDFIWCHECVHLAYDIHDEAECNEKASAIFVRRARSEREVRERIRFVESSKGTPYTSNLEPFAVMVEALSNIIDDFASDSARNAAFFAQYENGGFSSLDINTQKEVVDAMLKKAFRKSRRVDDRSAQDFFWMYMERYVDMTKDSDYSHFISRHRWVSDYISEYERRFGFAFDEVLPINNTDIYLWMAVGTLTIIAIIFFIRKHRK